MPVHSTLVFSVANEPKAAFWAIEGRLNSSLGLHRHLLNNGTQGTCDSITAGAEFTAVLADVSVALRTCFLDADRSYAG